MTTSLRWTSADFDVMPGRDILESPLLPGFACSLDDVFAGVSG